MKTVLWLALTVSSTLAAQSGGYPTRPELLPELEEIELARSAAPKDISAKATIYVLRTGGVAKAIEGTNGVTCMVARDLHAGSRYPICFDQEGSRSLLNQELMELRLRWEGKTEEEVKRQVATAYQNGTLKPPRRTAIAYMMSPRQMLFSSPLAEGRKVGPWHPHLMISVPNATESQFGLPPGSSVDVVQLERSGEPMAQLIVKVPQWSDGAPAESKTPSANPGTSAAAREALRKAERSLTENVERLGFAEALVGAMSPEAILLIDGAPILRGEYAFQALRAQLSMTGAKLTWMPYRVVISGDGSLGATFGALLLEPKSGPVSTGRYIGVWRKEAGDWKLGAYVQNGGWVAAVSLPEHLTRYAELVPPLADPFAEADREFARVAAESGAPKAFARFIAPDGITFAGTGEVNIGPVNVLSRMSEGPAAAASWKWWPARSIVAESGDLGVTVGEAEIRPPGGEPFYSKYLTIWQRQPDGSLKFIVDGGNSRPVRR